MVKGFWKKYPDPRLSHVKFNYTVDCKFLDENTIPENNQVQDPVNKTIDLSNLSMDELITELENLCETF